jgi:hypothetical protein
MSGRGLVSVRLPRSILQRLHSTARGRGMTTNQLARIVVSGLVGISGSKIREMAEPTLESVNQRLSLYLGSEGVEVLNAASARSGLSASRVLRRAFGATFATGHVLTVQRPGEQSEQSASWISILFGIAALIVWPVLGAVVEARTASAQQKGRHD